MKSLIPILATAVLLPAPLAVLHAAGAACGIPAASTERAERSSVPIPPPRVEPSDFYVDAVRGDDSNDGRAGRPFRTIQKAVDTMRSPGSVCTIRAGVYRETVHFRHNGVAGKPLRFQSEPGAVLSGAEPAE